MFTPVDNKGPYPLHTKLQKMQISSVHTTTFLSQLQQFFQQFYICPKFFTPIFLRKTVAVLCVVCKGRKPCPICAGAGSFRMGCLIYHCCSLKALVYCNWICKDFGTTTLWKLLSIYKTVEKIVALRKNVVVCMDLNCFFAVSVVVCEGLHFGNVRWMYLFVQTELYFEIYLKTCRSALGMSVPSSLTIRIANQKY